MKNETSWGQAEQLLSLGLLVNHSPLERIPSGVQPTSSSPGRPACSATPTSTLAKALTGIQETESFAPFKSHQLLLKVIPLGDKDLTVPFNLTLSHFTQQYQAMQSSTE